MEIKKIYNKIKIPKEKSKKSFWKKFFKILTVEFVLLLILEIFLVVVVGGGIFYIRNIFQKSYEERLSEKVSGLEKCQKDLKKQTEEYAYDKVRIADAINILLALQDYNFNTENLPESLEELKKKKYLEGNLLDPEFGKSYYYKKLSPEDYILCIYLSTGVWGTNIKKCPNKEEFLFSSNEKKLEKKLEEEIIIVPQTIVGGLRVRQNPSLDAKILTKIYPGKEYKILEKKDKWIKIKLKKPIKLGEKIFNSGWIWREYAKIK